MWGIDRLQSGELSGLRQRLRHSACAVLTHSAAVNRQGQSLLPVLETFGVRPERVFSPEHGLDGVAQAEEAVGSLGAEDERPAVISLYGTTKESLSPRTEDLDGLGTLLIDLVDVGSRYYTYVWTALLAARAAAQKGIHTVVLDRPNPLGGLGEFSEGKPQAPEYLSFVGLESVPIRHGVTLGEMLCWFFAQEGHALGPDGALSVVSSLGWERRHTAMSWTRPFLAPSPNMPTAETALLYPGGCLIEGTNLSEGRGTSFPFRVIGAPFLDGALLASELRALSLPGLLVREAAFRPSFEKHAGQVCRGVMLHVTSAAKLRPVETFLSLIVLARKQAPQHFQFLDRVYEFEADRPAFDLLCGTQAVRDAIAADAEPKQVAELLCPVDDVGRGFPQQAETVAARACI